MRKKLAWTLYLLVGVCLGLDVFPRVFEVTFRSVTLGILGVVVLAVLWDLLLKQFSWGRK